MVLPPNSNPVMFDLKVRGKNKWVNSSQKMNLLELELWKTNTQIVQNDTQENAFQNCDMIYGVLKVR
jgi:hypothetical protein